MLSAIRNHEDYLAAMDELYILMDTPPAGLTKEDADRQTWLIGAVEAWEDRFSDSTAAFNDPLNY